MASRMGSDGLLRIGLRTVAIAIAIIAAIDPAMTSVRRGRPIVSVRAMTRSTDSALALRVARQLHSVARVMPARFDAADAVILVGDGPPPLGVSDEMPLFIVRDDTHPRVLIESVRAPKVASLSANRRIDVTLHAVGARNRELEVLLRNGEIVIDRVQLPIADDSAVVRAQLSFVATAAGAARLQVEATVLGGPPLSRALTKIDFSKSESLYARAELLVDVVDRPLSILFYDPRPSWISTFVRRAIERDQHFIVTSRVVTSRNISTSAGAPPERLDDVASIERFDAIVVGVPEALTERDIVGLEAFMRRHGGSVVMLLDQRATGAYERLLGVRDWRFHNSATPEAIGLAAAANIELQATELLWPAGLPDAATSVATTLGARDRTDSLSNAAPRQAPSAESVDDRPVIWNKPVGAGRLVVSGALDAWRFRDSASSSFDRGWRVIIGEAAAAKLPPLAVTISEQILAPGESAELFVVVRDAALKPVTSQAIRANVSAVLESGPPDSLERTPIRLWPDGAVGSLRATLRAPRHIGNARVVVSADGYRTQVPLVVDSIVSRPIAAYPALSTAFAASHGGQVINVSQLATFNSVLARSLRPAPRRERWHPMRSLWWLLPFALALSGEWWMRRRRGEA